MKKTTPTPIERTFYILSIFFFLIFTVFTGVLYYRKIIYVGTDIVIDNGVFTSVWLGIVPQTIPVVIACVFTVAAIVLMLWRIFRPTLALNICSAVLILSCAVFLFFQDIGYEFFYTWRFVLNFSFNSFPGLWLIDLIQTTVSALVVAFETAAFTVGTINILSRLKQSKQAPNE